MGGKRASACLRARLQALAGQGRAAAGVAASGVQSQLGQLCKPAWGNVGYEAGIMHSSGSGSRQSGTPAEQHYARCVATIALSVPCHALPTRQARSTHLCHRMAPWSIYLGRLQILEPHPAQCAPARLPAAPPDRSPAARLQQASSPPQRAPAACARRAKTAPLLVHVKGPQPRDKLQVVQCVVHLGGDLGEPGGRSHLPRGHGAALAQNAGRCPGGALRRAHRLPASPAGHQR